MAPNVRPKYTISLRTREGRKKQKEEKEATGPHGNLVIIYRFSFNANRAPSFNPPPRTAYNAAFQDALSQLRR